MNIFQNNRGLFAMPPVTKNLIIINALCWLATVVLKSRFGIDVVQYLGLHYVQASDFNVVQLVTYMFMHDTSSISHMFFNMFSVFMFGRVIEQAWGARRFLVYYFVTGVGAAVIQQLAWTFDLRDLIFSGYTSVDTGMGVLPYAEFINHFITVGASGAVFGILLAFGMLFPNAELYMMFIPIPIKAKYFVIFYGVAELFMGVGNFVGDNVAHFAHLGGMLFGYILIRYWKKIDRDNGRFFY